MTIPDRPNDLDVVYGADTQSMLPGMPESLQTALVQRRYNHLPLVEFDEAITNLATLQRSMSLRPHEHEAIKAVVVTWLRSGNGR